jgi:nicotinamidase-related amidase
MVCRLLACEGYPLAGLQGDGTGGSVRTVGERPTKELSLRVRSYSRDPQPGVVCTEAAFHHTEWDERIPVAQAALVLVDVWDTHVIASHAARSAQIAREFIAPAVVAAREAGIAVVHAPSPVQARRYPQWTRYATEADAQAPAIRNWPEVETDEWPPAAFRRREGEYTQFRRPRPSLPDQGRNERAERGIDPSVAPEPEDFVVATGEQLQRLCKDKGILHLFFAGFATNICVPFKDYAIRAFRARGYNCLLLRDCTTAIEGHDTLEGFLGTRQAIRELEMADLAATLTGDAFIKACAPYTVDAALMMAQTS